MIRLFTFLGGILWLLIGLLWVISKPLAGFLLNWARSTNLPGKEQTYLQALAEAIGNWSNSYYAFMQDAGPAMFIGSGLLALLITLAWWKIEPIWISSFGLKLKVLFHNDMNLDWKQSAPFAKEISYYYNDGETGHMIGRIEYFIGVQNTTNKTIDEVRVRVIMGGVLPLVLNLPLRTDDNLLSVSIGPKTWRFFSLGHIYTEKHLLTSFEHVSSEQYERFKNMIINGLMIRHIDPASGQEALQPLLNNNGTPIQVEITGRDVQPLYAEFSAIRDKEPALYFVRQSQRDSDAYDIVKRSRKFVFTPSMRERIRLFRIRTRVWIVKRFQKNVTRQASQS